MILSATSHSRATSGIQGPLWSARARDWAEVQEPLGKTLYQEMLDQLKAPASARLLDVGCGSGVFCALAAHAGMKVSGIDASAALLAIAQHRVPGGYFQTADMEQLPFADGIFDVVTAFNSLSHAGTALNALREAYRALRPGGRLLIANWAQEEVCDAASYFRLLATLAPLPAGTAGPFSFAAEGALEALSSQTGFTPIGEREVVVDWNYPDAATAMRGLLSSGPAVRVIKQVGEETLHIALRALLERFRQSDGSYRLKNTFRSLIARK